MDPSLKIIVVEDHDELRQVTVLALLKLGYEVRGVESAVSLYSTLNEFKANLLILDLNLPGEDGLNIAKRMRSACPDIGIIMVTVREHINDKVNGYTSGADIYLTKPTSIAELEAAIEALSRRLQVRRETKIISVTPSVDIYHDSKDIVRHLHSYLINLDGKLPSLDDLAKKYGISARKLNEIFTQMYGSSIYAFTTSYRLTKAKEIIINTNVPLKVISYKLGYSHVNHFITMFSKKFGFAPGSLRKKNKMDPE